MFGASRDMCYFTAHEDDQWPMEYSAWSRHAYRCAPSSLGPEGKPLPFLADQPEPHFFLGSYDAIRRDYLPEDYLRDSGAHNVLTTVHCEAEMDRSRQVAETQWLTDVNARYGFPGAIVAHAWFHTDNAEEILAAQSQFPLVRGSGRSR